MTDLGRLPNLSDVFRELGGGLLGDTDFESPLKSVYSGQKLFQRLGDRLGSFFALLHSPQTLNDVRSLIDSDAELANPFAHQVVLEGAIKPVGNYLRRYPQLISADEVDQILTALVQDFSRPNKPQEESLVLGDCWTGAVLVSDALVGRPVHEMKIGVIDWEFAGIGRGVHGDMAQLLAHLELLDISACQSPTFHHHQLAVRSLMDSLTYAYRRASTHPTALDSSSYKSDDNLLQMTAARSACLSHGAEIIINAFWKRWRCLSNNCPRQGDPHKNDDCVHQCVLVQRMVERGLAYLRLGHHFTSNSVASITISGAADVPSHGLLRLFQGVLDVDNADRSIDST